MRVRVNGLIVQDESLLLVKLQSPLREDPVWIPPGGGVEFGETMHDALRRELLEETGTRVDVHSLRYVTEVTQDPVHAVELYFDCTWRSGRLTLGRDPEYRSGEQLLKDVAFIPLSELDQWPVVPPYLQQHFPVEYHDTSCHTRFIPYFDAADGTSDGDEE